MTKKALKFDDEIGDLEGFRGSKLLKKAGTDIVWTIELWSEFQKCKNDPIYFAENYMKVVHVDRGIETIHLYEYQKEIIRSVWKESRTIAECARQSGKTTALTVIILWYVIFHQHKVVAILANRGETAQEILNRIQIAYENLPHWLQQGVVEWNKQKIVLENKSVIFSNSTSKNAIRGYSVNLLFVDEVAAVDNWDDFWGSVSPVVSSGKTTKIVLVSTVNGLNHFYKFTSLARSGKSEYNLISVTWRDVPGRDEAWKQTTLSDLNFDEEKFRQEFENEYMGSSGTLISGTKLKALVEGIILPSQSQAGVKMYESYIKENEYVIIVDVSRGKGLDYSAFHVINITKMPYKQVMSFRDNFVTPVELAQIVHRFSIMYGNAHVLVETNDIGQQVGDLLYYDFECENLLFTDNQGAKGKVITTGMKTSTDKGVRTTKTVKNVGCSILKLLIEQDQLIIQDQDTINELTTFSRKAHSYEAESGHHDDLVMCLHRRNIIETEDGPKTIKWIVDNKYKGKVLSYNKNGVAEWNSVTNHISRTNKTKKWISIGESLSGRKRLYCTTDHKCAYIPDIMKPSIEYIEAEKCDNKYLVKIPNNNEKGFQKRNPLFNDDQLSSMIGMLLGDASISKNYQFSTTHCKEHYEYTKYIHEIFGGTIYKNKEKQRKTKTTQPYTNQIPSNGQIHHLRDIMYIDGIKKVDNILKYITPISLAFWYMDDGSRHNKNEIGGRSSAILCTDSFTVDEHHKIIDMFKTKFGLDCYIQYSNNKPRIKFNVNESEKFWELIAPYIHPIMGYKIPHRFHKKQKKLNNTYLQYCGSKSYTYNLPIKGYESKLYDITVENNHNFVANETLVHNCLVLFAWLTEQQYFKMLTDIHTLMKIRERTEAEMEDNLVPFGVVDYGNTDDLLSLDLELHKHDDYWMLAD